MSKMLVICGPTATGKTSLGVKLAKMFNGEIISADSRQVYKGMDIGTGKDLLPKSEFRIKNNELGISSKILNIGYRVKDDAPIWLVDIVEPDYPFNVGEYAILGKLVIDYLHQQNKLPIIVGGTGLYIKALTQTLPDITIPRNSYLRKELDALTVEKLQKRLNTLNPTKFKSLNGSDQQNPRRLQRAIEIEIWKNRQNSYNSPSPSLKLREGIPTLRIRGGQEGLRTKQKDVIFIGLTAPRSVLFERIKQRVQLRIKQGLFREIKSLLARGYSWDLQSFSATGYREWQDFFTGNKTQEEVVADWQKHEEQYAKRQLTWFKKIANMHWLDITACNFQLEVYKLVATWYNKN